MAKITVMRTDVSLPTGLALDGARTLLFRALDGFREDDKRAWRKFWKRLLTADAGEIFEAEMAFPRSGPFHRRHMSIEARAFDSQDKFKDFDSAFRPWMKIGAGWVTWAKGPKGGIVPLPRSISYSAADQAEFEEYHLAVVEFIRGEHFGRYLWPHLSVEALQDMIEWIVEGRPR